MTTPFAVIFPSTVSHYQHNFPPLNETLYVCRVKLFAEKSKFTRAVFQLVVVHKTTPLEYILQGVQRYGSRVAPIWDCRKYKDLIFLPFGRTLQICHFNLLHVCTYRSELVATLLFNNSINKIPSQSQNTLTTTLRTEFCSLHLFFCNLPAVPI